MRSDAARNAESILRAAREVVAEQGLGASMAAIAARAGVAVGTLYRHHPDKGHLVAAVVEDAMRRMVARVEEAAHRVDGGSGAGDELVALLGDLAEVYAVDRLFKGAAEVDPEELAASDDPVVVRGWASFERLVEHAREAGALRPGVGVGDLLVLVTAVPTSPERRRTYLDVVLAGLRAPI